MGSRGALGGQNFEIFKKMEFFSKCRKLHETSRKLVPEIYPYNENWGHGAQIPPPPKKKKKSCQRVGNCLKHKENLVPKIALTKVKNFVILVCSFILMRGSY